MPALQLNPYERPETNAQGADPIDSPSRESLAATIRAFLASDITAFEFDAQLDDFRSSKDAVIQHVVEAVWFHYDDCDDHRVCMSKAEWDYFQRLLLVLSADCQIDKETERIWSLKQLVAAASLCVFAILAFQIGWGTQLLILAIPFGFVSIALSFWHAPAKRCNDPFQPIIFPFATFTDLAIAYQSSRFRKTQYPKHIADRTLRSPFMTAFWQIYAYVIWLILSPVPLLFQMLPETRSQTCVKAA
ncbi:MAG: hypothetical protein KDB01_08905 [Planctomycetaceae bacterium]|nr:hypothetical protein [Planctomycetaceae bacterium]